MASIDLLEELKLNDYFPQKLSFSDAIKLGGISQNGYQEQYGLNIVRKLLMFDYTALDSITIEINNHLNKRAYKKADNKVQHNAEGVRQPQRCTALPSWMSDTAEQNEKQVHPMDLLIAVMNCCDDLLRQVLVEKMFVNKLSIPVLLPGVKNGSHTLLLLALRSLVLELKDRVQESSSSLTDTLVDVKNLVVSFIRVGNLHRSKSKLVNELLYFNSFNTFFHRECPNGSAKRSVSMGSIEAAWFQSGKATEEEFNCRLFTALNLRGDARDYPRQTQFLCQSSTLTVFMVDSFESFEELYKNVLVNADVSRTKVIVCYISPVSPSKFDKTYFEFLSNLTDCGVISAVLYDWLDGTKNMSDVNFVNDLRKKCSELFRPRLQNLDQMPTYTSILQRGINFGFTLDEDKSEYKLVEANAIKFVNSVCSKQPDCRSFLLPLQGEPWKEFGRLEREQRRKPQHTCQDEHFIAEKETEKRKQREIQCRSLIQQNDTTHQFSLKFHFLTDETLSYYLSCCKIKLDARRRAITSNFLGEYNTEKLQDLSNEGDTAAKLSKKQLQIENSTIGLEHMLREHGQMYEAVISEETRMKERLKNSRLMPEAIRNFPSIVAKLLLSGHPLELMDGDTSNVPITWLKAVLNQINIITNNAKVFVLSIVGVQSSGKSTLLNALFGLQFPVSAGRCTRGIYCHLVPVHKGRLNVQYDYILAVDTEGLGAAELSGNSNFRDNELATFAIGLADATIINMKGENWAEMKDILQIAAHGLIRVRKTKAELELMPRCMFVHQNVPAIDAEERNRLGQARQFALLDESIKEASHKEGFSEITKFNQVIKYDPSSHSWYFPDLWNGTLPKARISQGYIEKANELRQYLINVMRNNPSKLTISSFFLRMSDLWNAMLHNDFVLCFRNTQEITAGTILNDRISHEVDTFKNQNKLEQTKIRDSIRSNVSIAAFRTERERILQDARNAVDKNFTNMKTTLKDIISVTDICAAFKSKCETSLNEIKDEEFGRILEETKNYISVHMKKLEYENDDKVKKIKAVLAILEKDAEEVEKERLNKTEIKEFERKWQQLIDDYTDLVNERMNIIESKIKETIRGSIERLCQKGKIQLKAVGWAELFKSPAAVEMPEMSENDMAQSEARSPGRVNDIEHSKAYVDKANSKLHDARKKWELHLEKQRYLEFDATYLRKILSEVGELLGISRKEECEDPPVTYQACSNSEITGSKMSKLKSGVEQQLRLPRKEREVRHEADEICNVLPPGYVLTPDYIIRFTKFACNYTYNRSLENNKRLISMTDPLADIVDRRNRSIRNYLLTSEEASIEAVSRQIFDYARKSFVRDLGETIKTEVCKEENTSPTFKSKRAFLRTILIDLGQKTHNAINGDGRKQEMFKAFMLYVELGETAASEHFFFSAIHKFLREMLIDENAPETEFQKMVKNNVGKVLEKAKIALRQAAAKCRGCAKEYVRIFRDYMNVTCEIYFRKNTSRDFTDAVVLEIDNLFTEFLRKANVSFEALVCEDNKAVIRPLFEKIMGCRERCPFCSAPCSQSLEKHAGDHRANHYPMGIGGTVDRRGLLTHIKETYDATKERSRKLDKLSLDTCQTLVGTRVDIRTKATVQKYNKWYQKLFNSNCQSFRNYKELAEYENWDIPYSQDHNASLYWKWFMAQFVEELAEEYEALCPKIPEAWQSVTWEEAHRSLDEPYLNFWSSSVV